MWSRLTYKDWWKVSNDIAFDTSTEIEFARIRKGWTQQQLAAAIGTKQSSIARAESGTTIPSLRFVQKVANALGCVVKLEIVTLTDAIKNRTAPIQIFPNGIVVDISSNSATQTVSFSLT
jgi:transcriptional regulator with XRE-family HTH domain